MHDSKVQGRLAGWVSGHSHQSNELAALISQLGSLRLEGGPTFWKQLQEVKVIKRQFALCHDNASEANLKAPTMNPRLQTMAQGGLGKKLWQSTMTAIPPPEIAQLFLACQRKPEPLRAQAHGKPWQLPSV